MDIWNWVEKKIDELNDAGHTRLAQVMDEVPSLTVDGNHDKVDAMVPEGVALARKLNDKWVELFLRHWHMQSMVLHRRMVRQALPEAVSLLEFSHREDTRDCPQSICTVQDLANCYGGADGPAYVQERIDVARETLHRIDPGWPCYVCISTEYASALRDAGRYEEVLSFLDNCDREMLSFSQHKETGGLLISRIHTLIRLGDLQQAGELIDKVDNPGGGDSTELEVATLRALLSAISGDTERAERELPDFSAIDADIYREWLETRYLIAIQHGVRNDSTLDYHFSTAIGELSGNGAVRDAVDIGFWAVEAALARAQPISAEFHLRNIEANIPHLHKDLGASDKLAVMRRETTAAKEAYLRELPFDAVEDLLEETSRDDLDIESRLSQLISGSERWPDNEALVCRLTESLSALGRHSEAAERLTAFINVHPDSPDVVLEYCYLLLKHPKAGELADFSERHLQLAISEQTRANINWMLAQYHEGKGHYRDAADCVGKVLEFRPESFNARLFLANIQRETEDYPAAAANLERLVESYPDNSDLLWDQLVVATLTEDWATVRAVASSLDLSINQGEGEVREDWGYMRIQFVDDEGEQVTYLATRTGPVTATIEGFSRPGGRQYYSDEVVFEPTPLNILDHEDDEGNPIDRDGYYTRIYRRLKCVKPGGYVTYTLDGVSPGEAVLESVRAILKDQGVVMSIRSSEEYILNDENDEEYLGVYAYLLVPDKTEPAAVHSLLTDHLDGLEHPLVWPALAQAAEDAEAVARFREIAWRYGL